MSEQTEQTEQVETPQEAIVDTSPMSVDEEGTLKLDMSKLAKSEEEAQQITPAPVTEETPVVQEIAQVESEATAEIEPIESFIEEVTDEVVEEAQDLAEEVQEAVENEQQTGVELPENIQKVVDFMNETSGTLEDYVKLNKNYEDLDESQLLREYYANTKPHLDEEDIDFMMEESINLLLQ